MKYTIAILLGFFVSQLHAQRTDTVFELKSFTRTLSIVVESKDTLLFQELRRSNDFRTDTVVLDSTTSFDSIINYLGRWGVDTNRAYMGMLMYLRDSLKLAPATKSILFDSVLFREKVTPSSTKKSISSWKTYALPVAIGLVSGFLIFILLQSYRMWRKKNDPTEKEKYSGDSEDKSADGDKDETATSVDKKVNEAKGVSKIDWAPDLLSLLKKQGLAPDKKNGHNELVRKLLALVEKQEEEKSDVESKFKKNSKELKDQIEAFEKSENTLKKQLAEQQAVIQELEQKNTGLQKSLDAEKMAVVQDNEMILKALAWLKEVRGLITEEINRGNVDAANKRIIAGSINSFLLLSSYLDFRRKLSLASGEGGQSGLSKIVEPDINLRLLMGERVELKQPGPNLSDAPPLAGQLRDLLQKQGIPDVSPFGYEGHKIKS